MTCSVSNIDCAFQTKGDEMNSTQRVVENHIQRFREGDLDGVLEDFSPEAVVFTPSGTLNGKSEIKTLFQNLLEEFGKAGASETVRTAIFEGDYAYLIWSGETVDNNYEFATDTFVVRNGKIVMQSFAAKVTPKR
jgi:ketosteroid isomerase-like protein